MTRVLKLVRGSVELDLLNDAGIHLRAGEDNWRPVYPMAVAHGDPEPVVETMRLMCKGTSHDALAGTMQLWADMMQGAAYYRTDANGTQSVWLHAKLNNETGERRSIVHQIDTAWVDSGISDVVDANYVLFDAAIERGPYWEATSPVAMGTMVYTNLLTNGGFETAGAGGADVFAGWTENASTGAIADAGAGTAAFGSHAAMLTTGAGATTYLQQTVTVEPNARYTLLIWVRGDGGTGSGSVDLYDASNSAAIMSIQDSQVTAATWTALKQAFVTPAGCQWLQIRLYCSQHAANDVVYFDEVILNKVPAGVAGIVPYSSVAGDVSARLAPLDLYQPASGTALHGRDINNVWIGVRSQSQYNFETFWLYEWECETSDATLGTNAARVTDTTASGDYFQNIITLYHKVTVTPGTATWARRLIFTRAAINALTQNGTGNFLWLLRAKVSAGTWNVGLKWVYGDSTTASLVVEGPKVEYTETQWTIKETGIAGLPLYDQRAFSADMLNDSRNQAWRVEIWAERTAGTGTLDLDCMVPLPIDEGYCIVKNANMTAGTATYNALAVATSPLAQTQALVLDNNGYIQNAPEVYTWNWGLPPGDGALIIVAGAGTAEDHLIRHIINTPDTALLDAPAYYPRWLSLRGAE